MRHSVSAKKSLGQNFLNNANIPRLMADAAKVEENDVVLEVGPGTGVLTAELLARAGKVIAIEADPRAIEVLHDRFADEIALGRLLLLAGDARELDLRELGLTPGGYKIVANIPYYLSGFLFRTFLEHEVQPSVLVFLVQKEVAERITRDKKGSLLSLSVRVYGDPEYVRTVKKGNFTPQPKIDSAIIMVRNISKKRFQGVSETTFFTLLHEGFRSRRKQLAGNLSERYGKESVLEAFQAADIPSNIRGEDVPLERWLALASALQTHRKVTKNTQS